MYFFDLEDYATFFTSSDFKHHFNCNGYYNGKQAWKSDDNTVKIIWDNTLTPKCWRLSGDSLGSVQVINTNPATPPINGNWTVVGAAYNVLANQGACSPPDKLAMSVTKNDPSCTCDASLTVKANGGQPPYQYSYDNGVTYSNSPFKNSLCGNLSLTVMVKDSLGTVVSQLVQIPAQTSEVTYTMNLVNGGRTIISNVRPTISESQKYNIQVTPALPNGVTINFGLNLTSVFQRTPYANSANSSYVVQVKKNNTIITTYTDNTTETTSSANASPGCQNYLTYHTNYDYGYSNLTLTNTDVYEITIIWSYTLTCTNTPPVNNALSVNDENSLGPLGYGRQASASYVNCCSAYFPIESTPTISNLSLVGCNCCEVKHWAYFYNRS